MSLLTTFEACQVTSMFLLRLFITTIVCNLRVFLAAFFLCHFCFGGILASLARFCHFLCHGGVVFGVVLFCFGGCYAALWLMFVPSKFQLLSRNFQWSELAE